MKKKHIVTLTEEERGVLQAILSRGRAAARKPMHARILLKADAASGGPAWKDDQIAAMLEAGRATVQRVRKRFVEKGLEGALRRRKPRREYPRRRDGEAEAHLVALACQKPPEGRSRWTMRLLADRMVELEYVEQVSYQTVRRTLEKTNLIWQRYFRRKSSIHIGLRHGRTRIHARSSAPVPERSVP